MIPESVRIMLLIAAIVAFIVAIAWQFWLGPAYHRWLDEQERI